MELKAQGRSKEVRGPWHNLSAGPPLFEARGLRHFEARGFENDIINQGRKVHYYLYRDVKTAQGNSCIMLFNMYI